MRSFFLLMCLATAAWSAPPEEVVRRFFAVGLRQDLKGNARWAAVKPLMTPRFYEAVRRGVLLEGDYTLKQSGVLLFDMGMFHNHQRDYEDFSLGPSRRHGDVTIIPVSTVNHHLNNLTSQSDLWLLGQGDFYQIDDIYHRNDNHKAASYRQGALKMYQLYLDQKARESKRP